MTEPKYVSECCGAGLIAEVKEDRRGICGEMRNLRSHRRERYFFRGFRLILDTSLRLWSKILPKNPPLWREGGNR